MEVRSPVSRFIPYAKALLRRPNISGIITTFRESSDGTHSKNYKFGGSETSTYKIVMIPTLSPLTCFLTKLSAKRKTYANCIFQYELT